MTMKNIEQQHLRSLIDFLAVQDLSRNVSAIDNADIDADVRSIYRFFELQRVIRFFGQRYWEAETLLDRSMPGELLLETVAAHTYQVAVSVRWLAPHFPELDPAKAVDLALLHDQPEILTGDRDPVGSDGTGSDTHAFNAERRYQKENDERAAIDQLADGMRQSMREPYKALSEEYLDGVTVEAQFVRSVDKLQALAFVRLKKRGHIGPEHMAFTIRYARIGALAFPGLQHHFQRILSDILNDVAQLSPDSFSPFCEEASRLLEETNA